MRNNSERFFDDVEEVEELVVDSERLVLDLREVEKVQHQVVHQLRRGH